jgi:hypothetical protein
VNIRKCLLVSMLLIAVAVPAMAMQQGDLDFSRYDIILSRKPFGANASPSPVSVPVAPQRVDPTKSFIKDYNMCAIRESLVGVSVGLVNIKAKPARSFFLFEGETEDGVLLVEADFREEKALLRKGDEECWISMSGAVRALAPARVGRYSSRLDLISTQDQISNNLRHRTSGSRPVPTMSWDDYKKLYTSGKRPPAKSSTAALSSLRSGRKGPVGPKLTREEIALKRRQYNMDLIRARGTKGIPLPMELTLEEDAQLVEEGVLDPR